MYNTAQLQCLQLVNHFANYTVGRPYWLTGSSGTVIVTLHPRMYFILIIIIIPSPYHVLSFQFVLLLTTLCLQWLLFSSRSQTAVWQHCVAVGMSPVCNILRGWRDVCHCHLGNSHHGIHTISRIMHRQKRDIMKHKPVNCLDHVMLVSEVDPAARTAQRIYYRLQTVSVELLVVVVPVYHEEELKPAHSTACGSQSVVIFYDKYDNMTYYMHTLWCCTIYVRIFQGNISWMGVSTKITLQDSLL